MSALRPIETRSWFPPLIHIVEMRSLGNESNSGLKLVYEINREDRSHRSQRSYVFELAKVTLRPNPAADLFLGREDVSQRAS